MYNNSMNAAVIDQYLSEAIDSLKEINPVKIILFGSTAYNQTDEDSDLDFLVVLDEDSVPTTYEEKLEQKVRVRTCLTKLNKKVPIDLIVYTIPEYEEFKKINNSFCQEIHKTGKTLYEKAN